MEYLTFFICVFHFYESPTISMDFTILRHFVGLMLVIIHSFISVRKYQVNGPSRWFYGDFFINTFKTDVDSKLHFTEAFTGTLALWGGAMLCNSKSLLSVTIFAQISHICFFYFVDVERDADKQEKQFYFFENENSCCGIADFTPEDTLVGTSVASSISSSPSRSRSISVTETVMQAMHELESIAIPHFKSLVQSTKRSVTKLANAARLEETLPREDLPLHLYSLKLIGEDGYDAPNSTYRFGEVRLN